MSDSSPAVVEGNADFHVGGSTYKTFYKVFGTISSTAPTPLVMLHGGPGIPSQYMELFSDLTVAHSVPVVVYDQIGCGRSTSLPDKGGEFFKPDLFMDELENLLKHLKITDNFDLGGQSWGCLLGALFAGKRRPPGLKHLILLNPLARMDDWVASNKQLCKTLPQEVQDVIVNSEASGTVTTKEYQEALGVFMGTYLCRLQPWPEPVMASLVAMQQNPHVGHLMYGKAWLECQGTLKHFDITEYLPKIQVPTLVCNAEFDQSQDFVVQPFFDLIPKVRWFKFNGASHMLHFEQREKCMKLVGQFLGRE